MKKRISVAILLLSAVCVFSLAQSYREPVVDGVCVDRFKMERSGNYMSLNAVLDFSGLKVDANRAVLLTPSLVNGSDSLVLPSVGIYGRRRYYFYVRNGESMLSGAEESVYRASKKPDTFKLEKVIPYEDWMNGGTLKLYRSDWGCCNSLLADQSGIVGNYFAPEEPKDFFPTLVYIRPEAEIKHDSLEGLAYIDFPVDQTVIYSDYRRNMQELGKIQATIDSVRGDRDITINKVWLKGYASPESPYSHNRDLAIGRTKALKEYICRLYKFDESMIETSYEPEDWAGLRRYVESSNLEHRQEILAMIDSNMEPDAKELKIKRTYPEEYRFLLQSCYPALRHTDYRVVYTVRDYSTPEEIARIMRDKPQKLSLNEFYLLSQIYEPGSDEFTEVFETAVRMYPADETANLNATNAAMRRGDLAGAARYIEKAGNTPEAVYARGALAIRNKDYEAGRRYMEEAAKLGVKQAETTLRELEEGRR